MHLESCMPADRVFYFKMWVFKKMTMPIFTVSGSLSPPGYMCLPYFEGRLMPPVVNL